MWPSTVFNKCGIGPVFHDSVWEPCGVSYIMKLGLFALAIEGPVGLHNFHLIE